MLLDFRPRDTKSKLQATKGFSFSIFRYLNATFRCHFSEIFTFSNCLTYPCIDQLCSLSFNFFKKMNSYELISKRCNGQIKSFPQSFLFWYLHSTSQKFVVNLISKVCYSFNGKIRIFSLLSYSSANTYSKQFSNL